MQYIYNDEDNVPMNEENFVIRDIRPGPDGKDHVVHQFKSIDEAAKYYESLPDPDVPFTDSPEKGCWNCTEYNGTFCTLLWNNLDEAYKVTWRDEKEPDDWCPSWHEDKDAVWENYHGTDNGCTPDP